MDIKGLRKAKYNIMEDRKQYRIIVPVICLLSALCIFLPFITWKAGGVNITGFEALQKAFTNAVKIDVTTTTATMSTTKTYTSIYGMARYFVTAGVIFSLLAAVAPLIRNHKKMYHLSVLFSALSFICWLVMLFSTAKRMNFLGISSEVFYVKDLGYGFWLAMALSFLSIVMAMIASKTSPTYIILSIMSIVWVLPILWIVMISFRTESGSYTPYFWPKSFTINNYVKLITETDQFYFMRWFSNTLIVAIFSCLITTVFVLSTAYVFSRLRFKARKPLMNVMLILGMFPGFMSMIAIYYILKGFGMQQSLASLVLVYSGGAALSYYVAKGFFDTIPKALDEAATIDGATNWVVFTKITIPLSKSIIIYTILTAFTAPWMDFIFAKVIMGDNYKNYTVALGLWTMLQREFINVWYTRFAAGAVIVSIPIAILFICMQRYYVDGLSGSVKG